MPKPPFWSLAIQLPSGAFPWNKPAWGPLNSPSRPRLLTGPKPPSSRHVVEVLFFGSPAPVVPKGGEQTVAILRAFDGNQERG